ncbi:MAG: DNA polymerase III subunit delta [Bryobacteraceae bacterium]
MTAAQFLARVKRGEFAPAYLFLGNEAYQRRRCRDALVQAVAGEDHENGLAQYDLAETPLAAIVDDARALSLFASRRVVIGVNAEAVLPRTRSGAEEEDEPADASVLAGYLRDPSPGVVLVFEATRYGFEGDDKRRLERIQKFFSAVHDTVELMPYSSEDARAEAQRIAHDAGIPIEPSALDLLVESLAADVARIAVELEKLALYCGAKRAITVDDVADLVPDARATTIFALVGALGRRDRPRALQHLETLSREGEYLPLALAFLSTQFRMALAAREANLHNPSQIQAHLTRLGMRIWPRQAAQVYETVSRFSKDQLQRALELIFAADRGLRDARPDDRTVMERFIFDLTA